jgi:hypothetical protein
MTPVAGAAWAAAEAFREAGYESFSVAGSRYNDGRVMPRHEDWPPGPREIEMIRNADVIFCHQGHPYKFDWYPKHKPTVFWYHSQPLHMWRHGEKEGWPWCVEGQYQTRLYPGSIPVPNLFPLRHPWYQPQPKPDRVQIVYSPSNSTLAGYDDKGYSGTIAALQGLDADVHVLTGVSLEQCLAAKAKAHIVIDECVTGSYHRNSLEGLALGCVVVNNCDGLCEQNIRDMTGGAGLPFVRSNIGDLSTTLRRLVEMGPSSVAHMGYRNREWMEGVWNPAEMIERNLKPLMDEAVHHAMSLR